MKQFINITFRLPTLLFLMISARAYGQYDYGFLYESYFGRQPSARVEAMGKAYCAVDGDLASIAYNPAGTATIKGLEVFANISSPYYFLNKAIYYFAGVGYHFNKYLTVSASFNRMDYNTTFMLKDRQGNLLKYTPINTIYTINASAQPIKEFLIGFNLNQLRIDGYPDIKWSQPLYLDFGMIKKFNLHQNDVSRSELAFGASITNLNFGAVKLTFNDAESKGNLPVITKYGLKYQLDWDTNLSDTLSSIQLTFLADFQALLNSRYLSGVHTGLELWLLELVALRVGYYRTTHSDYGRPDYNLDHLESLTYGFGLQAPLHKFTKLPLKIEFNHTNLPQPSLIRSRSSWGSFYSSSLRITWLIRFKSYFPSRFFNTLSRKLSIDSSLFALRFSAS